MDLGLPQEGNTAFALDPQIKAEALWAGPVLRPAALIAERAGPMVRVRDDEDRWRTASTGLRPYDSMVSQTADPRVAPGCWPCGIGCGPGGSTTMCAPTARRPRGSPDRDAHHGAGG